MKIPFLNLNRQYEQLQNEIEFAVVEVLRSGAYIGGKYVDEFESEMKSYLNAKHVIPCANGTDAIMIALRACGVGYGDEVITTPFTFFASAEAIAAIGAIPVFADVNEGDFNIDTSKIEDAITEKTKAILPVHIFGWPCDMEFIDQIAKKHNLCVVEDAAQAIGCEYSNKNKVGNTNNLVTFSFYPTKNLGAFGDAGMITTNDDNLAIIARALCQHGMGKNGAKAKELLGGKKDDFIPVFSDDPLYDPYKYFNHLIAYNSRLDAVQAVILSIKLRYLDEYNKKREEIANIYSRFLKDKVITPPIPKHGKSSYHQYTILTNEKEELGKFLAEKGIGSGAFYPVPMHLQTAFDYLGYKKGDFPVAEMISSKTVCLPIFPELKEEEVKIVSQAVIDFHKGGRVF